MKKHIKIENIEYFEQTPQIVFENLIPNELYKVDLETIDLNGTCWISSIEIASNGLGVIDLTKKFPLNGSYESIDSNGLFWAMAPKNSSCKYAKNVSFCVDIYGQEYSLKLLQDNHLVEEFILKRYGIKKDQVVEKKIDDGKLIGKLYSPIDERQYPALIFLGGSEGGLNEARPPILTRLAGGMHVLSIAYFSYDDLPEELINIPLETIEYSYQYLQSLENVNKQKIFIYGASKGAEMALLGASLLNLQFAGIILISPSSVSWTGWSWLGEQNGDRILEIQKSKLSSWAYNGVPLPPLPYKYSEDFFENGPFRHLKCYKIPYEINTSDDVVIKVENIDSRILIFSGDDDQIWPASQMAQDIYLRMKKDNKAHLVQSFNYPDVGHQFILPGLPAWTTNSHDLIIGGSIQNNAIASRDFWDKMVRFLNETVK